MPQAKMRENLLFWSQTYRWLYTSDIRTFVRIFMGEWRFKILDCFEGKVSISWWYLWYRVGSLFLTVLDLSNILRFIFIYLSKYLSYIMLCMVLECASVAEHWSSKMSTNTLARKVSLEVIGKLWFGLLFLNAMVKLDFRCCETILNILLA